MSQYLVILENESEFEAIVSKLNMNDMGVFGAVALAAASRHRSTATAANTAGSGGLPS